MGMDGVEILMGLEATFDIQLDGADTMKVVTAGDLLECVLAKIEAKPGRPLREIVFERLRAGVCSLFAFGKNDVREDSPTLGLLLRERIRSDWSALGQATGLTMPPLRFSQATNNLWLALTLASAGGGAWAAWALLGGAAAFFGGVAGLLAAGREWGRAERRFGRTLPAGCETLGGLADAVLAANYRRVAGGAESTDREAVWCVVRQVVIDVLGCAPGKVTRDAHLVNDLGMS